MLDCQIILHLNFTIRLFDTIHNQHMKNESRSGANVWNSSRKAGMVENGLNW